MDERLVMEVTSARVVVGLNRLKLDVVFTQAGPDRSDSRPAKIGDEQRCGKEFRYGRRVDGS